MNERMLRELTRTFMHRTLTARRITQLTQLQLDEPYLYTRNMQQWTIGRPIALAAHLENPWVQMSNHAAVEMTDDPQKLSLPSHEGEQFTLHQEDLDLGRVIVREPPMPKRSMRRSVNYLPFPTPDSIYYSSSVTNVSEDPFEGYDE